MVSGSSNILIEGNTFENTWGQLSSQFNTDYTGLASTNSTVQYNTFSGTILWSEAHNGNGITIQNNLSIDSPIGVEDDQCANCGAADWSSHPEQHVAGIRGRLQSSGRYLAVMAPSLSPAATVRAAAIIRAKPSVTIIVLVILYNLQGSRILRPVAVPRLHMVAIFLDRTVFARVVPGVVDRIHRSEQLGTHGPTQLLQT